MAQHNGRHSGQQSVPRTLAQPIPVNAAQQPVIFNPVQHQVVTGYPQSQPVAHSARVLHMSHSAPNLNPVQIPVCRRGVPSHMTSSGQHYGQVTTIPEHVPPVFFKTFFQTKFCF